MLKRRIFLGFTLVELMVTVIILAALSLTASGYYKSYRYRMDLSQAREMLLNARFLGRSYFLSKKTYDGFCNKYPKFSQPLNSRMTMNCGTDTFCFRVRVFGRNDLNGLRMIASEHRVRTVSVPRGWTMPRNASTCLITAPSGSCL